MNVLVVSDRYPEFGASGAGHIAHTLAKAYCRAGDQVAVITTRRDGKNQLGQVVSTDVDGIKVHAIGTFQYPRLRNYYSLANPVVTGAISKLLGGRSPQFDAAHIHNVHEFLSYDSLRIISKYVDGPNILTYHDGMAFGFGKIDHFVDGDPDADGHPPINEYRFGIKDQLRQAGKRYNPVRNRTIRWYLCEYVDSAFAVSHELGRALRANRIPLDGYIHNGIETTRYNNADAAKFLNEYRIENKNIVLFGGRVSKMKGGHRLAAAVKRSRRDLELVVTGRNEQYVRRMREDFPELAEQITTTGWVDEHLMPSAFRAAEVVAVPSLYLDPLPTVAIEAQAAGTPVLATCFGGAKETVIDNVTGEVANPFDISSFTSALDRLADESKLNACQKHIDKYFNIDQKAEQYRNFFK